MKNKILALCAAVMVLSCAAVSTVKAMNNGGSNQEESALMAPSFTATTSTGDVINLADFKGQPVVLEWINFECPYVKKHYDSGNMQALQAKYAEQDVVWIVIGSSAEGKQGYFVGDELATKMADANMAATHYVVDATGEIGQVYNAKTTPHMFVIGKEGEIVYQGAIDSVPSADKGDIEGAENYVSAALDAYMAGEVVATSKTQPYGCSIKY